MSSIDYWPDIAVIPLLGILRQENLEFWASLGYITSIYPHKTKTRVKNKITGSI